MPRKSRQDQCGNYFHVLVEGFGTEQIFGDDKFKEVFINCLAKAREVRPARILAYTVLDTHAHVLLAADNVGVLADYFRRVNAEFAMRYNRALGRTGYVFKDRFRSEVISDDKMLLCYANEIHRLCMRDGIVEHHADYKFSSYNNYLTGEGFLNLKVACRLLGSAKKIVDIAEQPRDYDIPMITRSERKFEDKQTVLKELYKKYKIVNNYSIRNAFTCRALALELRERTGASIREMAIMLNVGRETLRKWLLKEQIEYIKVTEPILFY